MTTGLVTRSPFDGTVVAEFAPATPAAVDAALTRGRGAASTWAATSTEHRAGVLRAFAAKVDERAAELAQLVTRETGKRLEEASGEVAWTARSARWYADHPPVDEQVAGAVVRLVPLGLVAVITPWNAPLITPAWKLCPALMAGNAIVWKPSELATAAALAIETLWLDSGLPAGVLELVPGLADAGAEMVADDRVDGVHFTGSSRIGGMIAQVAGGRLARCALELGGSSPALVLEDADLDAAADAVVASMLAINGQKCTATRRVLVRQEVAGEFIELLRELVASATPGDPADPATRIGPLITPGAAEGARSAVQRSLALGARRLAEAPDGYGVAAFAPVVLSGLAERDPLRHDELLAPVLTVEAVRDDDEAVDHANASRYGLAAAVHTRDRERGMQLARRLEAGVVGLNRRTDAVELEPPFGGRKKSGNGIPEGGRYAYAGLTERQAIYGSAAA